MFHRTFAALLISLGVAGQGLGAAPVHAANDVVVFDKVNVIPMDPTARKRVQKRQTVVVQDGRIVAMGKAGKVEIPEGAEVVKGKKKFLMPGLYDMHAHGEDIIPIPEGVSPAELYSMYFANGVLGLYDPWGYKEIFGWKRDIDRGKVVGPRLHFTSPGVNDDTHATADEVEASVRKWAKDGYTAIKTHSPIARDKFLRLHDTARELGLPVVGHALRPGYSLRSTLEQGQHMLTHVEEILSTEVDFQNPETHPQDLADALDELVTAGTWVTTTVGTYKIIVETVDPVTFEALFARPEMSYLPPSVHDVWRHQNIYLRDDFLQDAAFWARLLDVKLYIVDELARLGALDRLLLGTDVGIHLMVPGFSIHDELALLVAAGLSPWEALLTGTYNPAVYLEEIDEAGTVAVGKRADLVLLDKSPLKRIDNMRQVAGILIDGNWLPKADLDERLETIADRWDH